MRVEGLGFRVSGVELRVGCSSFGGRVLGGLVLEVWGLGFRAKGSNFVDKRVWGSGCGVQTLLTTVASTDASIGVGCRVQGRVKGVGCRV